MSKIPANHAYHLYWALADFLKAIEEEIRKSKSPNQREELAGLHESYSKTSTWLVKNSADPYGNRRRKK